MVGVCALSSLALAQEAKEDNFNDIYDDPSPTITVEDQPGEALSSSGILLRARNTMSWLRNQSPFHVAPFVFPDAPKSETGITPVGTYSSGPLSKGWSFWSSGSISRLKDKRPAWRKKGDSATINLGLEKTIQDNITLGLSGSFTHVSEDTFYNGGHSRTDSLSLTPYFSYTPLSWLSFSVTGGYVHNRERMRWINAGIMRRGKRRSNGYTLAATLETARWFSNIQLTARAGLAVNRDRWKGFTDSLGTAHAGFTDRLVEATVEGGAYFWLDPIMPYIVLTYTYDIKKPRQESDRDDLTITGGFAFYGSGPLEPLSLDLSGSAILGRKSQRNITVMLGMRISF